MILVYFALVAGACLWIMKACDPFEEAANYLGRNMAPGTKGATINAIASSMPEFLATMIFLFIFHDKAGFSAGVATTAGSAVFNAMVIPSLCIFAVLFVLKIKDFNLNRKVVLRDGFFLILAEITLIIILTSGFLAWWHGAILLTIYLCYMGCIIIQHRGTVPIEDDEDDENESEELNTRSRIVNFLRFDFRNMLTPNRPLTTFSAIASLVLATAHLTAACYLMTDCVIEIAEYFNMNTFFVAVIVAAAATSVPDTVISIKDAVKGKYDDAIANAVGSNIFDICICLGLPLMLYSFFYGGIDISGDANVAELRIILLLLTGLVVTIFLTFKKFGYAIPLMFFSGYVFYASYSWSRGMNLEWAATVANLVNGMVAQIF